MSGEYDVLPPRRRAIQFLDGAIGVPQHLAGHRHGIPQRLFKHRVLHQEGHVRSAAAAVRVTASPRKVPLLSALFGFVAVVGGILLALGSGIPISPYVTTLSFAIYGICRIVGARRSKQGWQSVRTARSAAAA